MAHLYSLIGQANEQKKMNDLVASDTATATQKAAAVIAYYDKYDKQRASKLYNYYLNESSNINSKYYNQYAGPTNQAVWNLTNLGFNVNQLTDDWFDDIQNRTWIKNKLEYRSGSTNTPSAPTKKSTNEQRIAYELYQYDRSREQTKQAQQEYRQAMNEAAFMAGNQGWNYSDDYIIKQIRGTDQYGNIDNSKLKKKYPLLAQIESKDMAPLELNSGVEFSDDILLGAIWAARNGGGTGNAFLDAGNYLLGTGVSYQENPDMSARLEPLNPDNTINADYHPYSVGSTIAYEDALFFGIYGADDQWLQDNQRIKYYGTDEEKKHYANIETSVNNQHATDTAEQTVYDYVNYLINKDLDSSEVKDKLDTALAGNKLYVKTDKNGNKKYYTKKPSGDYEEIDLSILNDIDASVGKNIGKDNQINPNGKLVPLSIGTNYKYDTLMGQIDDWYAEKAQQPNDTETTNSVIDDMAYSMPEMKFSSEAEANVFQFKYTTDQQKTVNAKNKKVKEAVILTNDILSDDENIVMNNAGSVAFNQTRDFFGAMRTSPDFVKRYAEKTLDSGTKNVINSCLDSVHSISEYENTQANLTADQEQFAKYEAKYGPLEYLQETFEPIKTVQIGDFSVTMVYHDDPEDEQKGYTVENINAPGRGGGMNYEELLDYDDMGIGWATDILNQADEAANEETNKAVKILAAQNAALSQENGEEEVKDYKELSARINKEEQAIAEGKDQYDEQKASVNRQLNKLRMARAAAVTVGMDTSKIDQAFDFLASMVQFYNEPQLPVQDMSKLEYLDYIDSLSTENISANTKRSKLHEAVDSLNARIKEIDDDQAYAEETGYQIPDRYAKNMKTTREDLENERKSIEYELIAIDSDPEKLRAEYEAGKAFEKKYGEGNMYYWVHLFGSDDFKTLRLQDRYRYDNDIVRTDEELVYYALLGRKVLELGDNLDAVLQGIGKNPQAAGDILREVFSDAAEYQRFMENEDTGFGMWANREYDRSEEYGRELVESGLGGGILANAMATIGTVGESISSAWYTLDRLITGKRFNKKSSALRVSGFKNETRAATRESIDEYYKDNPVMKWVANLGYEIYCNHGDSTMNAMITGMLMPNISNPILNELFGSMPMGASAGLNSAIEAVENGADTEQAWLILGTSFLAETVSEAVTRSNIMEALGETGELTKDTIKNAAIDWLTSSGVEEMIGETATDVFENWANQKATEWFDNPNYESDHQKRIDYYYAQGYTEPGEAEAKAFEEEIKGYVHTAFVSYISAGTNILTRVGKAAVNTAIAAKDVVNGYRNYTKADQKLGGRNSTFTNLKNDLMKRNVPQRPSVTLMNTKASGQEAGAAAASEAAAPATAEERYNMAEQARITAGEAYTAARADYDKAYKNERSKRKELNDAKKEYTAAQKSGNQDRIAIAQKKMDVAQQEYDAAKITKEEARTKRNDASDAFESAKAESEAASNAYEAEKATPDQKQASADVLAIGRVDGSGTTTQTEMIASILDNGDGNETTTEQASAAAAFLGKYLGDDASFIVQQVMDGTSKAGISREVVTTALQNAALGNGAATALIQSEEFKNASNEQKAQMLADTVEQDQNDAAVQGNIANSVKTYRTSMGIVDLASQGHFDKANEAQKKAEAAAKETAKAETQLQEKQEALDAAVADAEQKAEAVRENPSDDNTKQHADAMTRADNADESKKQYEDHLAKQQEAQQTAEAEAQKAKEDAMTSARDTTEQAITQQDQQRANEAAAKAEQHRQQEEAAAKAKAEQDEMTGKADEDRRNALIEEALDRENLQGEKREIRREQLKKQLDKVKIKITDLGKSVSNTEGRLALYAFERKLGVPIVFDDLGPVNSKHITRGQYVYNEKTGEAKIVINENLIKAGKMTVGQAIVEAALHEVLHSVRATGAYNTYRHVVTEALYGNKSNLDPTELYKQNIAYRAAIDDMIADRKAAGDKNFQDDVKLEDKINLADEEIVADFARLNLADKDVVQRFMDAGMGGKMRNILHNINQALKNYGEKISGKRYEQWKAQTEQQNREIEQWNAEHPDQQRELIDIKSREEFNRNLEYLRRAERAYQKAMEEAAKTNIHPNSNMMSVSQIAESTKLGMVVNDDTLELYMPSENGDIIGDGNNGLEKGKRYVLMDGVTPGRKITADMIVNTPVGMLIDMGLDNTEFTDEQGNKRTQQGDARQMFADLMNLCARYKDNNLIWEIAGSEFSEAFSALKSNSDPQYKNTVDFGTICSKTQAIVDVLSQTMVDRVNAIRQWNEEHAAEIEAGTAEKRIFTGLTREDIMEVYNRTHNAGLSVPCPVCYVFSRWMGVPGMLGQMNRFQNEYVVLAKGEDGKTLYDENGDAVVNWDETFEKANGYLLDMVREYTKTKDNPAGIDITDPNLTLEERNAAIKTAKDKIAEQKNSINNKIRTRQKSIPKLYTEIGILQEKLEKQDLTDKQRQKIEEQIKKKEETAKKKDREIDQFEEDKKKFEAFNWVSQVLCLQHTEGKATINDLDGNGNFVMDKENFRYTPEEILFDLNRSGEFAGYAKNWRYRTTRGAGMGKAIMPYSGASIGDIIHGEALRWKDGQNPLLNMDRAAAEKAFKSAQKRVKQQNLVGGQRFQSTSDFRPEWGLDYIMSFLEMQALGSKVQMYTKVAEAVDFLGSIGADVNLSIMAKNNGYHIATDEEIALSQQDTDEGRELKSRMGIANDENGDSHLYVMEFSDVTGMDYATAKEKSKKFNNVQMILVGMNDVHIRLALGNQDIDFVIPWHSSGNSKDVLQQLVSSVGEQLLESSDYTDTQTDQIKSHKEGKGKNEKTIDDRTQDEIKLWDARVKLLTEGGEALTQEERQTLMSNDITRELYRRFTEQGYDPDCYGVTLTKDQAEQVFPYEYWDKTSTRENADVNGQRFVEYCDALGLVPRFSQFKDVPGYWKLLIDRKMYDNNILNDDGSVKEYGKYRDQKVVDVTKAKMDNDPNQALDPATDRKKQVYQLPEATTAKYGRKNFAQQTENAIRAANEYLSEKYDGHTMNSMYGDLTAADMDLMTDTVNDYEDAVARQDWKAAQEDVDFYAEQAFADSKVRDEDGNLMVVYHGTMEQFTQFDMSKSRINMDIQGSFFSPWEIEAGGYGENVGKYYLNIQNPAPEDVAYAALNRYKGQNEAGKKAREYLISQGYDGVANYDEFIAFYPEQIKSSDPVTYDDNGNVIPLDQRFSDSLDIRYSAEGELSAADRDLMQEQELNQTLAESGALTAEEVAAYEERYHKRPLEGRRATEGEAQRAFGDVGGMLEKSDEIASFAKSVVKAQNTYFPDTNFDQINRAVDWIKSQKGGYAEALEKVTSDSFDYRSADGQARMVAMMGLAAAKNDVIAQASLADAFNRQGTDLGRALQARKLFMLMTPEGRKSSLRKMLQNAKDEMGKQGKKVDLKFSDWIYEAAAEAETQEDMRKVQQVALAELGEQLPSNWKDRLQTFRMLSMLANPRTHIRNIIGNAMFIPAVSLKNKLSAVMELGVKQGEKTKTLKPIASKEARAFAREDAETMKGVLTGEAKYSEAAQIKQNQAPLGQFVKVLSDLNGNFLEGEDWFFLKGHYRRALSGWMEANGYTADQLRSDQALLEKGRQYAISEAQKATYRDFSKTAQTLNQIARKGGALGFMVEAALPFKKTPINILRRGIEYSPAGIAKSLTYDMIKMKQYLDYQNGKLDVLPEKALSPTQVIDDICSGLSGTAITVLGFLLAGAGAASCGLDDDEDKFEKAKGNQEYAINPGKALNTLFNVKLFGEDVTFTLDWAAPLSMPFFVGAAIRNQMDSEGAVNVNDVINAIGSITEPVFNLSMLDGVNSLLKTNSYDETNVPIQIFSKMLTNYASSFVPSALGALARTIDDTRRKSFVPSDQSKGFTGTLLYGHENAQNKIPFYNQENIPVRDVWGNEDTTDFVERFFENFISPGYINEYKEDPIINEMARLYDATGDKAMIPEADPDKTISYTVKSTKEKVKHVLTDKEWDKYKEVRNKTAFTELSELIENPDYQNASDATQVQMIKDIWSHANKVGQKAVIPDIDVDDSNVATIAKDSKIASTKNEMIKALNAGDYDAYDTMVQALYDEGLEESDVRAKIRDYYREQYKDAYRKGLDDRVLEIEDILDNTGIDFSDLIDSWQEAVDNEQT